MGSLVFGGVGSGRYLGEETSNSPSEEVVMEGRDIERLGKRKISDPGEGEESSPVVVCKECKHVAADETRHQKHMKEARHVHAFRSLSYRSLHCNVLYCIAM